MKEENQNVQHVLDELQHTIAQLQAAIEHEDTHQGRHHWLLQFSAVCVQIDAIIEDEKQQRRQREEPAVRG